MSKPILFFFFLLCINFSFAQTIDASLLEINFHEDSDPQKLTSYQTGFFFTATDGNFATFGRELWYSEGKSNSTYQVKDIFPGANSSNPSNLLEVNGILYFTANNGVNGVELWKSDKTETGTKMIKDINPLSSSEYYGPFNFMNYNGILFFTANDGVNGFELWRSDGSESGTYMVKDINPNGDSRPLGLFVFNGILYFIANDGINGLELWKSDGTLVGTTIVKNINRLNSGFDYTNQFLTFKNHFYFMADDGTNGFELWKSDGTEAGTVMVKNIAVGFNSSSYGLSGAVLNDMIVFEANDGINGTEIWKSDGTESGTSMVKNINNTARTSLDIDTKFTVFNNQILFIANDGSNGFELWKTDGTSSGTMMVKNTNTENDYSNIKTIHIDRINNKILFFVNYKLWSSDGTEIGTIELPNVTKKNLSGLEESFVTTTYGTFFTGQNERNGNELFVTDGTPNGTSLFADLNFSRNSNPARFTDVNGNVVFRAGDKGYGNQLYKSDGTIGGTTLLKDISTYNNCIDDISEIKVINGTMFFSAVDGVNGYELWKSDGTASGTKMVKDIFPGSGSSMYNEGIKQNFTIINNTLYFSARDSHGTELWRSDGTEEGTYLIKDIFTAGSSHPHDFVLLNNVIYFIAQDAAGNNLWKTDGTNVGTTKVMYLNDTSILKKVKDKLFIVAETSGTTYGPHDVWISDGTSEGTKHLKSFGDNLDSDIRITTILNDEVYFVAKNPETTRSALYKTDGTQNGTVLLFDAANHPTNPEYKINELITCGSYVYFSLEQNYNSTAKEIWRTNGVITEKIVGSNPMVNYYRNLTVYKNNLLYLGGNSLKKIWFINDTMASPSSVEVNVVNGNQFEEYEGIEEFGATSNKLYFRAKTEKSGSELYVTDFDFSTLSVADNGNYETINTKEIVLYPNPADKKVNLQSLTSDTIFSYQIIDNAGRVVKTSVKEPVNSEINIDTSSLSSGIYYVKAKTTKGNVTTLKLLVNH
jgi:ELWxxDGT repeat protein